MADLQRHGDSGCSLSLGWTPDRLSAARQFPRLPRSAVNMAVGILGAVIMPHNIYLHSALVQSRWGATC